MHHHKQNKRDKLLEQEKHIKAKLQVEQIMVQKAPAMEQQLVKLEVVDPEELLRKMREFLRIRYKN